MLKTERDKKICAKYSEKVNGCVQCDVCPLSLGLWLCKAVAHYNRKTHKWEYDFEEAEK